MFEFYSPWSFNNDLGSHILKYPDINPGATKLLKETKERIMHNRIFGNKPYKLIIILALEINLKGLNFFYHLRYLY